MGVTTDNKSKPTDSPPNKSKKSSSSEADKYRECGDVQTKREDNNLPEVDQSTLEPIKSTIPECYSLKVEYDNCFNKWFSNSFIRGSKKKSPCEELLSKYTSCVQKGLKEQNFELFQPSCYLNYTTDPNDGKFEHPRKTKGSSTTK